MLGHLDSLVVGQVKRFVQESVILSFVGTSFIIIIFENFFKFCIFPPHIYSITRPLPISFTYLILPLLHLYFLRLDIIFVLFFLRPFAFLAIDSSCSSLRLLSLPEHLFLLLILLLFLLLLPHFLVLLVLALSFYCSEVLILLLLVAV